MFQLHVSIQRSTLEIITLVGSARIIEVSGLSEVLSTMVPYFSQVFFVGFQMSRFNPWIHYFTHECILMTSLVIPNKVFNLWFGPSPLILKQNTNSHKTSWFSFYFEYCLDSWIPCRWFASEMNCGLDNKQLQLHNNAASFFPLIYCFYDACKIYSRDLSTSH